jgi:hypothetical protein
MHFSTHSYIAYNPCTRPNFAHTSHIKLINAATHQIKKILYFHPTSYVSHEFFSSNIRYNSWQYQTSINIQQYQMYIKINAATMKLEVHHNSSSKAELCHQPMPIALESQKK